MFVNNCVSGCSNKTDITDVSSSAVEGQQTLQPRPTEAEESCVTVQVSGPTTYPTDKSNYSENIENSDIKKAIILSQWRREPSNVTGAWLLQTTHPPPLTGYDLPPWAYTIFPGLQMAYAKN